MKPYFDFRPMQPRLRRPNQSAASRNPKPAGAHPIARKRRERLGHFGLLEILGRLPE